MVGKGHSLFLATILSLISIEKGTAASLDTLFGTTDTDDKRLLYIAIALFVVSAIFLILTIIGSFCIYKMIKAKNQPKIRHLKNLDSIIYDAHNMVPLPRANTYSKFNEGYNNNYDSPSSTTFKG
ncbi:uncharacterized protein LOC110246022 [Exaiptasia diaphana]|uniref:Uncharacterized protein n=1 Tax=Exaiptasia diaphana TaxID=2652724 RepID=A0A913XP61_EXADI|nr:uncharacterized protein LOC110246022 [Exaiptasia diaphana]KXJ25137.1 hypothetical protein AC249_AIPGENE22438 [Exaiptasia diaphana]